MDTASLEIAAQGFLAGVGPFIVGLVVVALLIGAFVLGFRVRRREPAPPRPEEQPRLPDGGPVGEVMEHREPDEVPRGGDRLTPHQIPAHGNIGSRTSTTPERPSWDGDGGDTPGRPGGAETGRG
ncbi:DUF6479 family protein [Streptomyces sp. NPDC096152]|uniref:DUF6479 family protein n=1 Tax=Streptomyces sp. NPDC096152 TaxID=3366078 RepID=UPI00380BE195